MINMSKFNTILCLMLIILFNHEAFASNDKYTKVLVTPERIDFAKKICSTFKNKCEILQYNDENLLLANFLFNDQDIAILDKKIDRVFLVPYRKINQLKPMCYTSNALKSNFFIYVNKINPVEFIQVSDFYKIFSKKNDGGDYAFWKSIVQNKTVSDLKINKIISVSNNDISYIHSIFGNKDYADDVHLIAKDKALSILTTDITSIALVNYNIISKNVKPIKIVDGLGKESNILASSDYIYVNPNSEINDFLKRQLTKCSDF